MNIAQIKTKLGLILWRQGRWDYWKNVPFKLMVTYVATERPRRFPLTVQIEASSKCNLRCPSCSHARESDIGQHLAERDFCQILDRLPRTPARVILSGVGEPLLTRGSLP